MYLKPCAFIVMLSVFLGDVYGQGCSDAGFCSINSLRNGSHVSESPKHALRIGSSYGLSYNKVNVVQSFAEFNYQHSDVIHTSAKLTHTLLSGDLGITNGLSDLYLSSTLRTGSSTSFIAGLKIPLNDASLQKNGLPLPMNYQSSLGTFDLILGMGYVIDKLTINAAVQYPLTQNNNGFLATDYASGSTASTYISTNGFQRSPDALLRLSYYSDLNSKLKLVYSLLPIYHIGNDTYTDENGLEKSIEGSNGLTLNINAALFYSLKNGNLLEFSLGAPAIARDVRPDGLSQISLGVAYSWGL